jgi:alkaline phosphatase D
MMTKLAPHPLFGGDTAPFTNLDAWDGYPAERERVLGHLAANGIDNTVVLTGDIHSTWASDLPLDPFSTYDPTSGAGSLAVEFVTASVTADNLDEITGVPSDPSEAQLETIYPQLKDVELDSHGYFVLDLLDARAQADWFYSEILAPAATEVWARGWLTNDGENRIVEAAAPAAEKPSPPPLAPAAPPNPTSAEAGAPTDAALLVVGSYPNPASDRATIGYVLARPQALRVALYDVRGREVAVLLDAEQPAGVYTLHFDAAPLASGTYLYRFTADGRTVTRKMTVQR